ncbi:MAG TPA: hypothetical protein VEQ35_00935 [Beijerinckia sp.]|nr:hypothetical protein [Beijerinckia sp.]
MMADRLIHAAQWTAAFLSLGAWLTLATAALAEDCATDIGNLNKKRQGVIEQLNALATKGGKKQLDPVASCPKLRNLVAVEHELVAYLTKNKDWCSIPDDAIENIKATSGKSAAIANQACTIAAQMKKAQQQQQAGGLNAPQGQKLPTGPL